MKLAAHVLAYNVDRFLRPMLENVGPWVDRIYVAYPRRPFAYIENSREGKSNPTRLEGLLPPEYVDKIRVVEGDWPFEEDTRNACLDLAGAEGFDWLITQDADEFYSESSWENLRRILAASPNADAFVTTWYTFWKSSHYVIENHDGSIKDHNVAFATRCRPGVRFQKRRVMNVERATIIDEPCFHYGYVMSDEEMQEKLLTWSHAREVNVAYWYRYKWTGWSPTSRNLNPTNPTRWRRAVRFPGPQPGFSHQFALVHPPAPQSLKFALEELLGNIRAESVSSIREVRRILFPRN